MTYVAGVFLGIVVGFVLAAVWARRSEGSSRIGGRHALFLAVVAVALLGGSIGLARHGHNTHSTRGVGHATATTTSLAAPSPSSTTTTVTEPRAVVRVPDLLGKTRAEALATLKDLALIPKLQTLPSSSLPPGFVLSQNPVTQSLVTEGSTVSLVVSAAP